MHFPLSRPPPRARAHPRRRAPRPRKTRRGRGDREARRRAADSRRYGRGAGPHRPSPARALAARGYARRADERSCRVSVAVARAGRRRSEGAAFRGSSWPRSCGSPARPRRGRCAAGALRTPPEGVFPDRGAPAAVGRSRDSTPMAHGCFPSRSDGADVAASLGFWPDEAGFGALGAFISRHILLRERPQGFACRLFEGQGVCIASSSSRVRFSDGPGEAATPRRWPVRRGPMLASSSLLRNPSFFCRYASGGYRRDAPRWLPGSPRGADEAHGRSSSRRRAGSNPDAVMKRPTYPAAPCSSRSGPQLTERRATLARQRELHDRRRWPDSPVPRPILATGDISREFRGRPVHGSSGWPAE